MSEKKHFIRLDGLRGTAALLVLVHHAIDPFVASHAIPRASLAVDFFFLLSGFVIAYAYEGRLRSAQLCFLDFVKVRLIRLYPLAFVGFTFGLTIFVLKAFASHQPVGAPFVSALATGIFILPTSVQLAQGWTSAFPFNPPSWSLFFEVFINLVYAAIVRRLTVRALTCLVTLSGAALLLQECLAGNLAGGGDWSTFPQGFTRVTFPFFLGVLLFRLESNRRVQQIRRPAWLCMWLLVGVLLFPVTHFDLFFENFAVFALFPLIVFLGAAGEPPSLLKRILSASGQISYPLYVLHYPLIHLFSTYFRARQWSGFPLYAAITVECLVAIILSFAVLRWVDQPVRKMLSRTPKAMPSYKAYAARA